MKRLSLFIFVFFISITAHAQNEVLRELNSLSGISSFGVVVNIEKPASIDDNELNSRDIRQKIAKQLGELPIEIISDAILRQSDQYPILHIHINVMKAPNLTYPYSIELNFYQPVKLVLKNDLQSMASTWNKGQIGVVSEDLLHLIVEQAVYTSNLFKDEFMEVN
jgi:hypothetical protein